MKISLKFLPKNLIICDCVCSETELTPNVLRLCRSCELRTAIFSTKLRHNCERKNFRRKFISQFRKTAVGRWQNFSIFCFSIFRIMRKTFQFSVFQVSELCAKLFKFTFFKFQNYAQNFSSLRFSSFRIMRKTFQVSVFQVSELCTKLFKFPFFKFQNYAQNFSSFRFSNFRIMHKTFQVFAFQVSELCSKFFKFLFLKVQFFYFKQLILYYLHSFPNCLRPTSQRFARLRSK